MKRTLLAEFFEAFLKRRNFSEERYKIRFDGRDVPPIEEVVNSAEKVAVCDLWTILNALDFTKEERDDFFSIIDYIQEKRMLPRPRPTPETPKKSNVLAFETRAGLKSLGRKRKKLRDEELEGN